MFENKTVDWFIVNSHESILSQLGEQIKLPFHIQHQIRINILFHIKRSRWILFHRTQQLSLRLQLNVMILKLLINHFNFILCRFLTDGNSTFFSRLFIKRHGLFFYFSYTIELPADHLQVNRVNFCCGFRLLSLFG